MSDEYLRAVFLSNVCTAMAFAILAPSLVANLTESRTSSFLIAVVTSIWALPSVIGGPLMTRLIARFNARRCLLIGIFLYILILLIFPIRRNIWVWIFLQLLSGVVLGHFYLVTEAWLNHFSAESIRGRTTAIYGIIPAVGYSIGVGIYALVGFRGYAPFLAAALVTATGSVSLLLLRGDAGDVIVGGEVRLWATARLVPLLLVIGSIGGLFQTVEWGVFQIYALNNGIPVRTVGWILSDFFAGQILFTYPIGWVGDRVDRRVLLIWIGWLCGALMLIMYAWGRTNALWVIVAMMGGLFCSIYTLGLAVLGQRFDSKSLASAGASFMAAYSVGAVAGVPLVGALMDRFGSAALPLILAVAAAVLVVCAITARSEWSPRPG